MPSAAVGLSVPGAGPPSTCARENADIVPVARCDVRRRRRSEGYGMVRGVRVLVDEAGRKTAVQTGLKSQAGLRACPHP